MSLGRIFYYVFMLAFSALWAVVCLYEATPGRRDFWLYAGLMPFFVAAAGYWTACLFPSSRLGAA